MQRISGHKSTTVLQGYIDASVTNKRSTADGLSVDRKPSDGDFRGLVRAPGNALEPTPLAAPCTASVASPVMPEEQSHLKRPRLSELQTPVATQELKPGTYIYNTPYHHTHPAIYDKKHVVCAGQFPQADGQTRMESRTHSDVTVGLGDDIPYIIHDYAHVSPMKHANLFDIDELNKIAADKEKNQVVDDLADNLWERVGVDCLQQSNTLGYTHVVYSWGKLSRRGRVATRSPTERCCRGSAHL